ncbi:MAG TPA: hypothetical protein VMF58_15905 [Rhizomicrobium sp.]|nr:hypothetical protein [Rhizomicrobium sp.]
MKHTTLLSLVFAAVIVPSTVFAFSGYVVSAPDGTVSRGTSYDVTHFGTGQYEIDTPQGDDVHACAYSVTAGSVNAVIPAPAIATAVGRRENHTAVMVSTFDLNGDYADSGFHLIVQCAGNTPGGAAAVGSDGTLVRGVFATAAAHTGTGAYTVTFANPNLSTSCAYTASIGLTGSSGVSAPGFVNVAASSGGTIAVRTYDVHGNAADLGFQVYAACAL